MNIRNINMTKSMKTRSMIKEEEERRANVENLIVRYHGLLLQKNRMKNVREKEFNKFMIGETTWRELDKLQKQQKENEKKLTIQELLIIKDLNNTEDIKVAEETVKEVHEEIKKHLTFKKALKELPGNLLMTAVLSAGFMLAFDVPLNSATAYLVGAISATTIAFWRYCDIELELPDTEEYKALEKTYYDIIGKLAELKRE